MYRSKSATVNIAYDLKKKVLFYVELVSILPFRQHSARSICTYIRIDSVQTLNESVWTEIHCSQWYEIKMMFFWIDTHLKPCDQLNTLHIAWILKLMSSSIEQRQYDHD